MSRRYRRRSSRPRTGGEPSELSAGGHQVVEEWPDGDWVVRRITGSASTKTYRCPGCDQPIRPATPHVVAWPVEPGAGSGFAETGMDDRRHWHSACWSARGRRGPTGTRW